MSTELTKALEGLNSINYDPLLSKLPEIGSTEAIGSIDDAIKRQQTTSMDRSAQTVSAMQDRQLKHRTGNKVEELLNTLNKQKEDRAIRQEKAAKIALKRATYLTPQRPGIQTYREKVQQGALSLIDQIRGLPPDASQEAVQEILNLEQNQLVLEKYAFSPEATAAEILEILGPDGAGDPTLDYVRKDFSGAVELGNSFEGTYNLSLSSGHRTFFDKDESPDAAKLAQMFPNGITMQEALDNPKLMYKGIPLSKIIMQEMMAEHFLLRGGHKLSENAILNGYIPAIENFIDKTVENNATTLANQAKKFSIEQSNRQTLIALRGNNPAAFISNPNGGLIQREMILSGGNLDDAAAAVGIRIEQLADDNLIGYSELTKMINGLYYSKQHKKEVSLKEFSPALHEKLLSIRENQASKTLGGASKANAQLNIDIEKIVKDMKIPTVKDRNGNPVLKISYDQQAEVVEALRAVVQQNLGITYSQDQVFSDEALWKAVDKQVQSVGESDGPGYYKLFRIRLDAGQLDQARNVLNQISPDAEFWKKKAADELKLVEQQVLTAKQELQIGRKIQTVLSSAESNILLDQDEGAKGIYSAEADKLWTETYLQNLEAHGETTARAIANQALDRFLTPGKMKDWRMNPVPSSDSLTETSKWRVALMDEMRTNGKVDNEKYEAWLASPISAQEKLELDKWLKTGIMPHTYERLAAQGFATSPLDILLAREKLMTGNQTVTNQLVEKAKGEESKEQPPLVGIEGREGSQYYSSSQLIQAVTDHKIVKNNVHGHGFQTIWSSQTGYGNHMDHSSDGQTFTLGDFLNLHDSDLPDDTRFGSALFTKTQLKEILDSGMFDEDDLAVVLDDGHLNQMIIHQTLKLRENNKEVNGAALRKTFKAFSGNEYTIAEEFYKSDGSGINIADSNWNKGSNLNSPLFAISTGLVDYSKFIAPQTELPLTNLYFARQQPLSYSPVSKESTEYKTALNNLDEMLTLNEHRVLFRDTRRTESTFFTPGNLEIILGSEAAQQLDIQAIKNSRKNRTSHSKELMKLILKQPQFKGYEKRYRESLITKLRSSDIFSDKNINKDITALSNKQFRYLFGKERWTQIKKSAEVSRNAFLSDYPFSDSNIQYRKFLIEGIKYELGRL